MAVYRCDAVIISGTLGAGKSAVAEALSDLIAAGEPHAHIDLDAVSRMYPAPADDPWQDELAFANLDAIWPSYADRGARRVIIARAVTSAAQRERYEDALSVRRLTVVHLSVSSLTRKSRVVEAAPADGRHERFLAHTDELEAQLQDAAIADLTLANEPQSAKVTALRIAAHLEWV